jgi:aminoglycoside N3'-acetyltransferase
MVSAKQWALGIRKNYLAFERKTKIEWANRVRGNYIDYDSSDFRYHLELVGIKPGDAIFMMYSQDSIFLHSGKVIDPFIILNDLLDYLGPKGNILMLCFSKDRKSIIKGEKIFSVNRTPTDCGVMSEMLRRKVTSCRSLHPVFSAVSYGIKAHYYCSEHHRSIYPFDKTSPYYKIMEDGGKYLGVGVGFEAFTPCHMIDDHYKKEFKHTIYNDVPTTFQVLNHCGDTMNLDFLMRNSKTYPGDYNPSRYFDMLEVSNLSATTKSGIELFSFKMQDFFEHAVNSYDDNKITVWDTKSIFFTIFRLSRKAIRNLFD